MGHTAHSDNRENSTTHQSSSSCQVQQGAKNRFHSCSEKGKKKIENLRLWRYVLGGWLVTSGNLERIPVSSEQPLNSRITSPDKSDEIASKFLLSLFGKWLVAGGYLINLPSTGRHVRKLFTRWKWINILEEPNFLSIQTCYCCVWSYSMHIFNILIIQSKAREINKL